MPLQTSGPISLQDLKDEYKSSKSEIRLLDYYRFGGLIPEVAGNTMPGSGPLELFDFYGGNGRWHWTGDGALFGDGLVGTENLRSDYSGFQQFGWVSMLFDFDLTQLVFSTKVQSITIHPEYAGTPITPDRWGSVRCTVYQTSHPNGVTYPTDLYTTSIATNLARITFTPAMELTPELGRTRFTVAPTLDFINPN